MIACHPLPPLAAQNPIHPCICTKCETSEVFVAVISSLKALLILVFYWFQVGQGRDVLVIASRLDQCVVAVNLADE
jgi:hypothetical protein